MSFGDRFYKATSIATAEREPVVHHAIGQAARQLDFRKIDIVHVPDIIPTNAAWQANPSGIIRAAHWCALEAKKRADTDWGVGVGMGISIPADRSVYRFMLMGRACGVSTPNDIGQGNMENLGMHPEDARALLPQTDARNSVSALVDVMANDSLIIDWMSKGILEAMQRSFRGVPADQRIMQPPQ